MSGVALGVFLKSQGYGNDHWERILRSASNGFLDLRKAELPQGLIERASFKTANQEQLRRFSQVATGFRGRAPLTGNVQRRAAGNIPITLPLDGAEKVELEDSLHVQILPYRRVPLCSACPVFKPQPVARDAVKRRAVGVGGLVGGIHVNAVGPQQQPFAALAEHIGAGRIGVE